MIVGETDCDGQRVNDDGRRRIGDVSTLELETLMVPPGQGLDRPHPGLVGLG